MSTYIDVLYTHSAVKTMVVFKMRDMYLARVIPAFVMYCVNGASGSSLLIQCTDSMILHALLSIVHQMDLPVQFECSL